MRPSQKVFYYYLSPSLPSHTIFFSLLVHSMLFQLVSLTQIFQKDQLQNIDFQDYQWLGYQTSLSFIQAVLVFLIFLLKISSTQLSLYFCLLKFIDIGLQATSHFMPFNIYNRQYPNENIIQLMVPSYRIYSNHNNNIIHYFIIIKWVIKFHVAMPGLSSIMRMP